MSNIIPDEAYVTEVPLAVGVDPADGEIVDVGPYKHAVIWMEDGKRSGVMYCNNCGSGFSRVGRLKADCDPLQRWVKACAQCHVFQGFVSKEERR